MKPLFIVMDGVEGCGKSTQIALLADWVGIRREDQRTGDDVYGGVI